MVSRRDEYDIVEDAAGMNGIKEDATSTMSMRIPAARRSTGFVTWLAQLSEGHWEVVQYDKTRTMSMRIPAEGRSTSFVTWLAQLSEGHWEVVQYDATGTM